MIKNIAIVLFAYDEKGNLLRLLCRLHAVLMKELPRDVNIQYCLCVQGTDGTYEEARAFSEEVASDATVSIKHSAEPLGIYGACTAAFDLVEGNPNTYLMMDCDCNHQPEELPRFFEALKENTVVVGSRYCKGGRIEGMPAWKHILSYLFSQFATIGTRTSVLDKTSGYRLINGPEVPAIANQVIGSGFDFYIEFLLRLKASGLDIVEVPITFKVRTEGVSKMRIGKTIVNYLRLLGRLSKGF